MTGDLDPALHAPLGGDGDDQDSGGGSSKKNQATVLVELAEDRYRLGQAADGQPFAVPREGPRVVRMLRGGRDSLRATLADRYATERGKAPSSSALADAMLVLEGRAQQHPRRELALRVARQDDAVWLDLGGEGGRAAVVRSDGWSVADTPDVLFRRTALTGTLPTPERGSDLDGLYDLLNVDAATRPLVTAWLVAALLPAIPHPILGLLGEQGTGKTSAASMLTRLVDPSPVQVRNVSRRRDWPVATSGSWCVALDNVSSVPQWLSDALCRAVTGDGMIRRRLYSDAELSVLAYRRVVALTSIDPGALRGDLADRLIAVELDRIGEDDRLEDAELADEFADRHPALLGALLELTADVLAVLPEVRLDAMPRMADFARVAAAVDKVCGTDALGAYLGNRDELATDVVESDPVAAAVHRLVDDRGGWQGPAGELLAVLDERRGEGRPPEGWPDNARAMAAALKRCAPALRQVGIAVDYNRTGSARTWTLTPRSQEDTSDTVTTVTTVTEAEIQDDRRGFDGDGRSDGRAGDRHTVTATVTPETAESRQLEGVSDGSDGRDGHMRTFSPDTDNDACEAVHELGETPTMACRLGRHATCPSCSCACHGQPEAA